MCASLIRWLNPAPCESCFAVVDSRDVVRRVRDLESRQRRAITRWRERRGPRPRPRVNAQFSVMDFTTLYPTLPHHRIRETLTSLVNEVFDGHVADDGTAKVLCVQRSGSFKWVRTDARMLDSAEIKHFSADTLLKDLDFVLDNTFVTFGDSVYRQRLGVPMGFACSPMIAVLMLCYYELRMLRQLVSTANGQGTVDSPWGQIDLAQGGRHKMLDLAARLSRCARAIDDVLFVDITTLERDWLVARMYPPELELKEVCRSPDHIFYLDTEIRRDRAGFHTTLYDKREELARLGLMGQVRKWPHIQSALSNRCKYGTLTSFMHRAFRVEGRVRRYIAAVVQRIGAMRDDGYNVKLLLQYARRFARAHYTPRSLARRVHDRIRRAVMAQQAAAGTRSSDRGQTTLVRAHRTVSRRGEATQPAFRLDGPTARRFVTANLHEPDVVILDAVPVQRTPTPTSDDDLLEPVQRALTPPDDDTLEADVLYQVRAVLADAEHVPMPPDYIPDYVQLAYIVERVQNWRLWNQRERAPEADIRREICRLESELWELDVAADAFRRTG